MSSVVTERVCCVFGTFNRKSMLMRAVDTVRKAAGGMPCRMAIVDGGSVDGTKEWLRSQPDVEVICQELPLTGAVKAFNMGFAYAVDQGFPWVFHFNDDAELVGENSFVQAIERMKANPRIGEVAFEHDLRGWQMAGVRGQWDVEVVNGHLYANFGMVRAEAGIAAAKRQGDHTGRNWWDPAYRTYGADCQFACALWSSGWVIERGVGLRVTDLECKDELRRQNDSYNADRADSKLFWSRHEGWRP